MKKDLKFLLILITCIQILQMNIFLRYSRATALTKNLITSTDYMLLSEKHGSISIICAQNAKIANLICIAIV